MGYEAGKRIKGRKRHTLVDPLGLLLKAEVHARPVKFLGRTRVVKIEQSTSIVVLGDKAMAVKWTITIERGTEFGDTYRKEVRIDKNRESLFDRNIGLSDFASPPPSPNRR